MAKREKTRGTRRRDLRRDQQRSSTAVVEALLHLQMPDERPWKFLLPVIVLAFAVRVTIALLLLRVFFLRTAKKVPLAVAAGAFLSAVGLFDVIT